MPVPSALAEPWGAEELAAALDSVGNAVWALDLEGRCVFINQAACQVLGYAREECLGQRLQCRIHAGFSDGWHCSKEDCVVQKGFESESALRVDDDVFLRRDGTPIAVKYYMQPVVVRGRTRGFVVSMVDISARKSAEKAQRKSDERLSLAQQATGVGIFDANLKTGETVASQEQFRLYGLDPAGAWPPYEEWRMLVHPEDRKRVDRDHELMLSGSQPRGGEFRVVWPDRSIHWLHSQPCVLFDEVGRPTRLVGGTVDVTERVRAETALSQFFSSSPTPMAIWDLSGRIKQANQSWSAILGFTAAELEGRLVADFIHPEDSANNAAEFERLLVAGKRIGFELRVRCKDGSYRWILLNAVVQTDAQIIYVTAQDITARKGAEDALRDSEARFRSAFDNTLFGCSITAPDGRFLQVNRSLCRITGYTEQELLQRSCAAITHPDDAQRNLECERATSAGAASSGNRTIRFVRKDGEAVWVQIYMALVRDAQGQPLHFVTFMEDLTERKRAEETTRRSKEWLKFTLNAARIGLRYQQAGEAWASEQQFHLYGLEPSENWISRERWLQTIHASDRERARTEQQLAVEQGRPYDMQFRVVWPDGSVHWLLCRGMVFDDGCASQKVEITVDITDRKRAEGDLEELFRVSWAPIGVFGFDGRVKRFNEALLGMCGLTGPELTARPAIELFHPDDRAAIQAQLGRLISEGGGAEFECRGLRKDGSVVWLALSATAMRDEESILAIAYDITERKQAVEALRESERRFKLIAETIDEVFWMNDTDLWRIVYLSPAYERVWGRPRDHVYADPTSFLEAIHPDDREKTLAALAGFQSGLPFDLEFRIVRPDGTVRSIWDHAFPVRDASGKLECYVGLAQDITERKRTEDALRSKEHILSESQRIAHVGSWRWELPMGTNPCIWTPETYRIFGVSEDTFVPSVEMFQSLIHPDDRAGMQAWTSSCLAGEEPTDLEFRVNLRDGSVRHILGRGYLERDAEGKPIRMNGIAQDITERKRMADDLTIQAEKLARSNEELERFAYVASHDLQEPLRMVASFTQLLSKKYSGKLDETADRYISFAVDGAKRMQQLITDLLAFSRVNSKDLDLQPTSCEGVLQATVQNLGVAIAESGAVVEWDDPLPVLMADRVQLGQLFQNLIGNAIKFRGQSTPRVHIAAADNGDSWLFSVQDNGIGIDPKQADRVFQIFQRLHTREQYPGTGIGLAVCKKVVERHGGKLWVESKPGAGSNFRFTLPKTQAKGGADGSTEQVRRDSPDRG